MPFTLASSFDFSPFFYCPVLARHLSVSESFEKHWKKRFFKDKIIKTSLIHTKKKKKKKKKLIRKENVYDVNPD